MGAQLSLKAALPLAERIATASYRCSKTGPCANNSPSKYVRGPFYQHGLTWIPARMNNHMRSKVCDDGTYPFPNFNGCTVEVSEWIGNVMPQFIMNGCNYYARINPCYQSRVLIINIINADLTFMHVRLTLCRYRLYGECCSHIYSTSMFHELCIA